MAANERVKRLNDLPELKGGYVLYWMQASQRAEYNDALDFAARKSNELKLPLLAVFGLSSAYPSANYRHYFFMMQGLKETKAALLKKGIQLAVINAEPDAAAAEYAKKAALVVSDTGYTKLQRIWRESVLEKIKCAFYAAESNVVVPVEAASPKEEYSAATIRRKINALVPAYLKSGAPVMPVKSSLNIKTKGMDIENIENTLKKTGIKKDVSPSAEFTGGTSEAKKKLKIFIQKKLAVYGNLRSHPDKNIESDLSPYLHFGQISPVYIALEVLKSKSPGADKFLDELIIRRELAVNFVYYNKDYDNFECIPPWAKRSLINHSSDKREYLYTREQLENAATHDKYWNAAQSQMVITGKMHNYMRMYWGKKIIEWTAPPEEAYQTIVYLNDKYELDGRDPNGYAGAAWCFGKHDRPWGEREIFGKVRYMNAAGLKRKFDMDTYVKMWNINQAGNHIKTKRGK